MLEFGSYIIDPIRVLHRLHRLPQTYLIPRKEGDLETVSNLLKKEPQEDKKGRKRWLAAGGIPIDLLVKDEGRPHHDFDVVLLCWRDIGIILRGGDTVSPQGFWGEFRFTSGFLTESSITIPFLYQGEEFMLQSVHPAIIIAAKLSTYIETPARKKEKDYQDVNRLINYWIEREQGNPIWETLISQSINTLPRKYKPAALERLEPFLERGRRHRNLIATTLHLKLF